MSLYLSVLKQYAVFSGRARRKEYWLFILFNIILAMFALILDNILGMAFSGFKFGVIYVAFILAVLIPTIAVAVRRLHDIGKSGWMAFVSLIPVVGAIWLLILMVKDSFPGENQYGPNPKYNYSPETEPAETGMLVNENDSSTEDTVILIVVIWMVFSRLFWAIAPKLADNQYTPQWFETINTLTGLIWAFVPFGLAFAVKGKTKQLALFVLGGVYLFYSLYDVVFSLLGK
jgi:uncharacterized membrane protein YhaH (DUF805 family)